MEMVPDEVSDTALMLDLAGGRDAALSALIHRWQSNGIGDVKLIKNVDKVGEKLPDSVTDKIEKIIPGDRDGDGN